MTKTNQTLDQRAFKALLFEKFPRINKNCIESFMQERKLFTMKDFLNKYEVLNSETIKDLGYEIMEFIMSEV